MDAEAAKYIGAGLATLGMIGSALGVGNIFGNFLAGALRNPSAAAGQVGNLFVGAWILMMAAIVMFGNYRTFTAG
ncbi:F0F1 ATP synthase subunit C, partial [Methylobacterium organophilum]|nr:F0F1 ATP synthase subunit C [Methylobacterium organophilum]